MPRVSVVIPAYNHEKYVAEAIQSVLDQTFKDFEIVIVDDGSTDETVSEIRKFIDSRIRLFCFENNKGATVAMNKLISEAKGEYISVLSSDDVYMPDKLEKQVLFLDMNKEYGAVFSYAQIIDEEGKEFTNNDHFYFNIFKQPNRNRYALLNHFFHEGNCLCHPSMLIRKECYDNVGLYRRYLAQIPDLDFYIRLCSKYNVFILPENLIKFRIRNAEVNASGDRAETKIRSSSEYYLMLKEFLNIKNAADYLMIFPEASKYYVNGEILPEYAFAQMCLDDQKPACYNIFGLETLFNIVEDKNKFQTAEKLYGFTYKNLIEETGRHDIFCQLAKERMIKSKVYLDFGYDFSEEKSVSNISYLPMDGKFIYKFDLTSIIESAHGENIKRLRFDPNEGYFIKCSIEKVTTDKGKLSAVPYNAYEESNEYSIFITDDPIYMLDGNLNGLHEIVISGTLKLLTNTEMEDILEKEKGLYDEARKKIGTIEMEIERNIEMNNHLYKQLDEAVRNVKEAREEIRQFNIIIKNHLDNESKELKKYKNLYSYTISKLTDKEQELDSTKNYLDIIKNELNNIKKTKIYALMHKIHCI
jgi:glycosyltransferase involved in cell wall biosynthesis